MKNKGNYFGVSRALMVENFKLHWYLPVIIFSMYFLSAIFPLIITEKNGNMANAAMWNYNPGLVAILILAPIIVSCVMMGFYHRPRMSFALYSQPYSKAKLFNTQILTGWLMIVVPIILTGLFFLIIMGNIEMIKEPISSDMSVDIDAAKMVPAYTAFDVLIWVGITISKMSFFYFLYTLAGSLVGSTVMQILCSLIFVNITSCVVGLARLYSDEFILGYYGTPDWAELLIKNSNPIVRMFYGGNLRIDRTPFFWYFALGIVFFVVAKAICSAGKLERVGDSMISNRFESAITATVAALGGIITALIFSELIGGHYVLVIGAVFGLLLTFFIARIVIERSIKIFSARNLKILIASTVVMVVFLLIFAFDIVGYSKRIVNADNVASVEAEELVSADGITALSASLSNTYDINLSADVLDRETIEKTVEFNKYIIDNKLCTLDKDWKKQHTVIFNYKLRNGSQWIRRYNVTFDEKCSQMLQEIMTSESVVSAREIAEKIKDRTNYVNIGLDIKIDDGAKEDKYRHIEFKVTDKEDVIALLEARDKDLRGVNYAKVANYDENVNSAYADISIRNLKGGWEYTTVYFYFDEENKNVSKLVAEFQDKYDIVDEYYYP